MFLSILEAICREWAILLATRLCLLDVILGVCATFPYDIFVQDEEFDIIVFLFILSSSALMVESNKPATESLAP